MRQGSNPWPLQPSTVIEKFASSCLRQEHQAQERETIRALKIANEIAHMRVRRERKADRRKGMH